MSDQISLTISADTGQAIQNIDAAVAELKKLGSVQLNDPTNAMVAGLKRYRDQLGRLREETGRFAKDTKPTITVDIRANSASARADIEQLIKQLQTAAGRTPLVLPTPVLPSATPAAPVTVPKLFIITKAQAEQAALEAAQAAALKAAQTPIKVPVVADTGLAIKNIEKAVAELKKLGTVKLDDPTNALQTGLKRYRDDLGRLRDETRRFVKDKKETITLNVQTNSVQARAAIDNIVQQLQTTAGRTPIVLPGQLSVFQRALAAVANAMPAPVLTAFRAVNGAISSFTAQVRAAHTEASKSTSSFSSMGMAIAGLASVGLIADQFRKLYESIAQVERSFARFKFANNGDLKAAAEDMQFAREQADRLGLPLKAVEDGYSGLASSMRSAGFSVKETRETFLGVAEGARVLGLSADDTRGVFLALGQIASKGTLSMEELRQQLGERLPVVMQVAAKATGKTTQELVKLISTGSITAKDFLARFGSAMRRTFENDLPAATDSLQANVNRMQNAWEELRRSVGADAGGEMNAAVKKVTNNLKDPEVIDFAHELGTALANGLAKAIELFGQLGELFTAAGYGARIAGAYMEDTFGQTFRKIGIMWDELAAKFKMGLARLLMSTARSAEDMGFSGVAESARNAALSLASSASDSEKSAKRTAQEYDKVAKSGKTASDEVRKQIALDEAARKKRQADTKNAPKVGTQENQNYDTSTPFKATGKTKKPKKDNSASQLRQAMETYAKAVAEADKKIAQADRELSEAQLELELENRTKTYVQYLDKRAKLEKDALAEEMSAQKTALAQAEANMAAEKDPAKKKRFEADAVKIRAEITALEKKGATIDAKLVLQKEQFQRQVDSLKVDITANILDLQGDTLKASLKRLKQETDNLLQDKRVNGNSGLEDLVRSEAARKENKLNYEEAVRQIERARTAYETIGSDLTAKVTAGVMTATEKEATLRKEREKTLDVMRAQVDAAQKLADATGDPDALLAVARLRVGLQELANESTAVSRELRDGLIADLKTGISTLLREGGKLKDLLRSIASTFLAKLADKKMDAAFDSVAEMFTKANNAKTAGGSDAYFKSLGESISGGFFDALKSGWGVVSKLFSSLTFDNLTSTFKSIAAGISSLFSGLSSGASGLGGWLSSGLSFLGLGGYATGGLIKGPGTGTSDSIVARVSKDEFVVRAAAVRAFGVANLNHINRTGRLPPGFSVGGLVGNLGGMSGGASTVNNAISVSPKVFVTTEQIREAMRNDPGFERDIVDIAARNGKRIQSKW